MNTVTHALAVAAILGSAIIGGVFFAFSSFVMKALARLPFREGIEAMQSINVVVLNRLFLGVFMGTTVVSVIVAALAIKGWASPSAPFFLAGAEHDSNHRSNRRSCDVHRRPGSRRHL